MNLSVGVGGQDGVNNLSLSSLLLDSSHLKHEFMFRLELFGFLKKVFPCRQIRGSSDHHWSLLTIKEPQHIYQRVNSMSKMMV